MICFGKSAISFSSKPTGLFIRVDSTRMSREWEETSSQLMRAKRQRRQSFGIKTGEGDDRQNEPCEVESGA